MMTIRCGRSGRTNVVESLAFAMVVLCLVGAVIYLVGCPGKGPSVSAPEGAGPVRVVFDIRQDIELIRLSLFGEPPQFAIWLEEPRTHKLRTVFVTYRSGFGDWVGKAECPAALPKWFEVFAEETGSSGAPTFDNPAPDAVTGATPQGEEFTCFVDVPYGSRWICWIEMNLSGDFNESYRPNDPARKFVDMDLSGQPPLLYRAEFTAVPGAEAKVELYGQSVLDKAGRVRVEPVGDDVTTARAVFKQIEISFLPVGQ